MKPNYQNADMLDMVFEGRNQSYGAYVLRRDYNKSVQQAVMITVSAIFLFCLANYLHSKLSKDPITKSVVVDLFTTDIMKPPKTPQPQKQDIKLPQPKNDAKAKAAVQDLEKKIVHNDQAVQDSIPATKAIQLADAGATTNTTAPVGGIGSPDGTGNVPTFEVQKPAPTVADEAPTRTPDVMPEFPGGEKALLAFIAQNTEFPQQMRDLGISGRVISEFTINENGTVSDVHIVRSPSPGFDHEVTRVINTLPAFKPGMQGGHPVKVRFVVPVVFEFAK